jgi:hypothetical protein
MVVSPAGFLFGGSITEFASATAKNDLLGFLYVTSAAASLAWQRIGLGSPQRLRGVQDRSRTRSTAGRTLIQFCLLIAHVGSQ